MAFEGFVGGLTHISLAFTLSNREGVAWGRAGKEPQHGSAKQNLPGHLSSSDRSQVILEEDDGLLHFLLTTGRASSLPTETASMVLEVCDDGLGVDVYVACRLKLEKAASSRSACCHKLLTGLT